MRGDEKRADGGERANRCGQAARAAFGLAILMSLTPLAGSAVAAGAEPADGDPQPARVLGEPLRIEKSTSIRKILAEPAKWAGKTVRVEGEVEDVCPMKGCWMTLTEDAATVRIKVEDGVVVFPKDAKGRLAVAEGIVRVRELDRESWVAWERHLAEERGEDFDDRGIGEGPFEIVQIEGRGAEIRGL